MAIEQIYKKIAAHMVKGLMIHEQLANYFLFLGLVGYNKCHEYHFLQESVNYRKFYNYILKHYNKLIFNDNKFENPFIIPESWYKYQRKNIDINTQRKGVREGFERWIQWQSQTKQMYESLYKELINNNNIAFAIELDKYIKDVDYELAEAYQYYLNLKNIDFDMQYILDHQEQIQLKYKKKIKC